MRFIKTKSFILFFLLLIGFPNIGHGRASLEELLSSYYAAVEMKECESAFSALETIHKNYGASAYFNYMGEAHEFGFCREKNIEEAIKSFQQAGFVGLLRGGLVFNIEKNDPTTAQKWFRAAAFFDAMDHNELAQSEIEKLTISPLIQKAFESYSEDRREFPSAELNAALRWATELLTSSDSERVFQYALKFKEGLEGYPVFELAYTQLRDKAMFENHPGANWDYVQYQMHLNRGREDKDYLDSLFIPLERAGDAGIVEAYAQIGKNHMELGRHKLAYKWLYFAHTKGVDVSTELRKLDQTLKPEQIQRYQQWIENGGMKR